MLSEWNIKKEQVHCLIRDEGSNMKRAARLAALNDIDCTVHKMQLAIRSCLGSQENIKILKRKCKNISTHFNHSTTATTTNNSGPTQSISSQSDPRLCNAME